MEGQEGQEGAKEKKRNKVPKECICFQAQGCAWGVIGWTIRPISPKRTFLLFFRCFHCRLLFFLFKVRECCVCRATR